MDAKNNDAKTSITEEIEAAQAELRAAQEKLDAMKAKAASKADAAREAAAAVVAPVCAAPVAQADTTIQGAAPIELNAEPIEQATPAQGEPDWVPYTTGTEPQAAPQDAPYQVPVGGQPDYAAAQVPTAEQPPAGSYYWQQPQPDPYAQQQYGQPQNPYGSVPPQQQNYYQQPYAPIVSSKDHVAAGLLAIFLGSLGIHKFYLGYNTAGFIMLAVTVLGGLLTFGIATFVMGLIAFIEGIIYLTKSQSEFEQIYVFNQREWF